MLICNGFCNTSPPNTFTFTIEFYKKAKSINNLALLSCYEAVSVFDCYAHHITPKPHQLLPWLLYSSIFNQSGILIGSFTARTSTADNRDTVNLHEITHDCTFTRVNYWGSFSFWVSHLPEPVEPVYRDQYVRISKTCRGSKYLAVAGRVVVIISLAFLSVELLLYKSSLQYLNFYLSYCRRCFFFISQNIQTFYWLVEWNYQYQQAVRISLPQLASFFICTIIQFIYCQCLYRHRF